ncbi:MAG: hypothetical protein ACXVB9_02360 [Bdellovibrionota bacterium]
MKLLVLLALLAPCGAFGQDSLEGIWTGSYSYGEGKNVEFTLHVCRDSGGALRGSISEPNTFGDKGVDELRAVVTGAESGGHLSFLKTYDGTGGAKHSVNYEGELAGAHVSGKWNIPPNASGAFEMTKKEASRAEAGCTSFVLELGIVK